MLSKSQIKQKQTRRRIKQLDFVDQIHKISNFLVKLSGNNNRMLTYNLHRPDLVYKDRHSGDMQRLKYIF